MYRLDGILQLLQLNFQTLGSCFAWQQMAILWLLSLLAIQNPQSQWLKARISVTINKPCRSQPHRRRNRSARTRRHRRREGARHQDRLPEERSCDRRRRRDLHRRRRGSWPWIRSWGGAFPRSTSRGRMGGARRGHQQRRSVGEGEGGLWLEERRRRRPSPSSRRRRRLSRDVKW
ncbi:uncharacterized protein LOC120264278 [Dioscorea cayenensis subsp. rotundata]|uniref:Uncharacterized protein LOC120264278 n=1 Tax=Dioscorea cayennensis subsp. rotundata TaxID=55577 RepID=A0AB40BKQ2_DIOCR|nr:uncharacterized protein LOC120264278 [Dioscorea cayenensis subsp. rotundata]